jgi:hypothetical protein
MIGNRVRLILTSAVGVRMTDIVGTLHKLDTTGAVVWRENVTPEAQGNVFIPMHRIHEIVDLGRAP